MKQNNTKYFLIFTNTKRIFINETPLLNESVEKQIDHIKSYWDRYERGCYIEAIAELSNDNYTFLNKFRTSKKSLEVKAPKETINNILNGVNMNPPFAV